MRADRFFVDPVKLLKGIGVVAVAVFLAIYAFLQIAPRFSTSLETEAALAVTYEDMDITEGYVFRDEQVLTVSSPGLVLAAVDEGQRVAKDDLVAGVYAQTQDINLKKQYDDVARQIDILTRSRSDTGHSISDVEKIDETIDAVFDGIYADCAAGDYGAVAKKRDELLIQLNKRGLVVQTNDNFSAKLDGLEGQKNVLEAQMHGAGAVREITAMSAGYYTGQVDGYENVFPVNALQSLTVGGFKEMIRSTSDEGLIANSAGKIVKDFVWYIACFVDKRDASNYAVGKYYHVVFPYNGNETLNMELVNLIQETDQPQAILVLRTNVMPENFKYDRKQRIEIIRTEYTGLQVPKAAYRMIDGVMGVYVLVGETVEFRRAEILFDYGDYYLIDMSEDAYAFESIDGDAKDGAAQTDPAKRLALYDLVIVKGKDLYDGKIID